MRGQSLREPRPEYGKLENEPAAQDAEEPARDMAARHDPSPLAPLVPSRNRLHGTVNGLRALPRRGIACFVGPNASDNLIRAITDDLDQFGRDLIATAPKTQE